MYEYADNEEALMIASNFADWFYDWSSDKGSHIYRLYRMGIYNELMAQAYWKRFDTHGQDYDTPEDGLLTYFLPPSSGAKKGWGSETQDFFCCHGTLVQANSKWKRGILY